MWCSTRTARSSWSGDTGSAASAVRPAIESRRRRCATPGLTAGHAALDQAGPGDLRWRLSIPGEMGAVDNAVELGSVGLMEAAALDRLFASLHEAGYLVIGPTARDGAIVLDELTAAGDLPCGWGVQLSQAGPVFAAAMTPQRSATPLGLDRGSSSCIRPGRSCGPRARPTAASRSSKPGTILAATRGRRGWRSSACA